MRDKILKHNSYASYLLVTFELCAYLPGPERLLSMKRLLVKQIHH